MSEPAGDEWSITIQPQPGAVPAAVRIRRWLKLGKRGFGLVCTILDVAAEVRQLRAQLAMLDTELTDCRRIIRSLAQRVAEQSDLLSRRAERRNAS